MSAEVRKIMRPFIGLVVLGILTSSALADDRNLIQAQMQQMADAVALGNSAPWDKYLDANVIYAEEDDTYKGKAGMLKEIRPLPKGVGGTIRIELLSYCEDGDVAVALFRQDEREQYFGQLLLAKYLTNTTWKKRGDGWRLIAAQVLAEKTDPPAMVLKLNELTQYTGTYKLKDSERVYSITLTNGQLAGTLNSGKPEAWSAEVPDVLFIAGDPRIRKIFQRDTSGNITGFVERRESWDVVWKKISPS
jgi:Domain of unknown function (DUF4440)